MKDPSIKYEKQLTKLIRDYSKRIQSIYHASIDEISLFTALSGSMQIQAGKTVFDLFPALKNKIKELLGGMHDDILKQLIQSIEDSWQLSNEKNDIITDDITKETALAADIKEIVYNHNRDALSAFIKRTEKGMNLSKRVWASLEPFPHELEIGLADGIDRGKSAASMATDLKRFLREPDRLFRRVRDEKGVLKLSRAARNYNPGQGVYRSSYKNALRLTASETNIAYRSSDHERWKKQSFVKGIEVKLSNNHPFYDQCDALKGEYPKDFKFVSWHPRCRCYSIPILMTADEYDNSEDFMLGLTDKKPEVKQVENIPAPAKKWIKDNAIRIAGWKSKPYFINDNKKYVKELLKVKK